MKLLLHLCRKDHSFAKHALWSAWAVFLLAALMPAYIITAAMSNAAAPILGLLFAAPLFLVYNSTLRILRADSFAGGNTFIGTRPVTKTTLWLSKVVSIVAFVLVPWLLAKAIAVLAAGVHPSAPDWVRLLCEEILLFGTIAAVALVVGTHTRQFAWAVLITIAIGACVLWLGVSLFNRPGGLNFITEARHLKASQWLVAQTLITLSGLALSWLWITRQSPVISIAAGGLFAALVFLGSKQSDINFIERLAISETTVDPRISWVGDPQLSESSRNSVSFTTVIREIKVDGIPAGWIAFPAGVKSNARFADGTTLSGDAANSPNHGEATRALLPTLGDPRLTELARFRNTNRFTFFEGEKTLVREKAGVPCMLQGEALVELHEPIILANMPARSGESAATGRFRYRIERVAPSAYGMVTVEITAIGISLSSRDDLRNRQEDIEILLVNPRSGHHTRIGYRSGSSSEGPGWFSLRSEFPIEGRSANEEVDPVGFLKDARLFLIARRYHGTVRVPFEMPEIDLKAGR